MLKFREELSRESGTEDWSQLNGLLELTTARGLFYREELRVASYELFDEVSSNADSFALSCSSDSSSCFIFASRFSTASLSERFSARNLIKSAVSYEGED